MKALFGLFLFFGPTWASAQMLSLSTGWHCQTEEFNFVFPSEVTAKLLGVDDRRSVYVSEEPIPPSDSPEDFTAWLKNARVYRIVTSHRSGSQLEFGLNLKSVNVVIELRPPTGGEIQTTSGKVSFRDVRTSEDPRRSQIRCMRIHSDH